MPPMFITLVSSDGMLFAAKREVADKLGTIKKMMDGEANASIGLCDFDDMPGV